MPSPEMIEMPDEQHLLWRDKHCDVLNFIPNELTQTMPESIFNKKHESKRFYKESNIKQN